MALQEKPAGSCETGAAAFPNLYFVIGHRSGPSGTDRNEARRNACACLGSHGTMETFISAGIFAGQMAQSPYTEPCIRSVLTDFLFQHTRSAPVYRHQAACSLVGE